jgi:hypothetical protein
MSVRTARPWAACLALGSLVLAARTANASDFEWIGAWDVERDGAPTGERRVIEESGSAGSHLARTLVVKLPVDGALDTFILFGPVPKGDVLHLAGHGRVEPPKASVDTDGFAAALGGRAAPPRARPSAEAGPRSAP